MNDIIKRGLKRGSFVTGFLFCFVLCLYGLANAQDLEINGPAVSWVDTVDGEDGTMATYNFGNVAVGSSSTVTFDLFSNGPSAVWVYVISLSTSRDLADAVSPCDPSNPQYTLGAFSFNPDDALWNHSVPHLGIPLEMPEGQHIYFDVTFMPTALIDYTSYVWIFSNDSIPLPGMYTFIQLQGTGVSSSPVPEPASMIIFGCGLFALAGFRRLKR